MNCQAEINLARSDRAAVDRVETIFRNALLQALSEARTATLRMEPRWRDKLLDAVSTEFHPDGNIADAFTEAFHALKVDLDCEIEDREGDMRNPTREAAE